MLTIAQPEIVENVQLNTYTEDVLPETTENTNSIIVDSRYLRSGINTIQTSNWITCDTGTTSTSSVAVYVNGRLITTNPFTANATSSTATTNGFIFLDTAVTSTTVISSFTTYGTFISNPFQTYTRNSNVDWDEIRKKAAAQPVKKSTRNSIKRALKLMTGLGFEEDVRVFLNGDSIEVSHPESLFKFVITKYNRSLISRTERPGYSTPYKLELYTKSDVHIANLCVYMEETPVLDQVLGVAMFIKSGSEEMILQQANWSALTSDMELREIIALEYPYLEKKLRLNEQRYFENNSLRHWA